MSGEQIPSIKFNNGYDYPILGLGTWNSKPGEVVAAVKDAIDVGYRHFDCAFVYENEEQVGEAISAKIEGKVVSRSELFITSKLWCTAHKKELVVDALKKTLQNLRTTYLDLYLIHWPMGFKEGDNLFPVDKNGKILPSDSYFTETWKGMEECVKLGLAKSIGVSNFNTKQIEDVLSVAEIKPVNNQIECHPYLNQQKLIDFCKERNISITAYSPLGSPDRPSATPNDPVLLEDATIKDLAKKYDKTPAQVLIRYQIQRGIPVIPKSVTKSRIESNFKVFDFKISDEDMAKLNSLDRNCRMVNFDMCDQHKDYPFKN
ncbi:aldo-keto reductase family 1 member B1 [Halyomorpha halys]|uniref:aldo-keto reductase family 1 member B1 n=1 Tax=Halyomorpha halys TaxID=286706 RepID=UPI0006D4D509|nr:aldose reductase [Halyomorpha halys]